MHTHTYIHTYVHTYVQCMKQMYVRTQQPALTIMFVISVYECPHAVVPQLHHSGVQTGQHPRTGGVEGNACSNRQAQSDIQTDGRQTYRQTADIQTDSTQTDRQTADRRTDRRQTDRQTAHRQTDRQTADRRTDRRQTDIPNRQKKEDFFYVHTHMASLNTSAYHDTKQNSVTKTCHKQFQLGHYRHSSTVAL